MATANRRGAAGPARDRASRTQHGSPPRDVSSGAPGPLECAFIDEFLSARGYSFQSIKTLTTARRQELLRGASEYATLKLAEIESRAHEDLER